MTTQVNEMLREGDKGSNAFIQRDAMWKGLIVGGAFTKIVWGQGTDKKFSSILRKC